MNALTQEQIKKMGDYIGSHLTEHLESFVVVGCVAGSGQCVTMISPGMDDKTKMATGLMLNQAILALQYHPQ